jgi:hypothetical protein
MPKHSGAPLDELDDEAQDWTAGVERAVYLLEGLTAATWEALRELARANVTGRSSFAAWRSAVCHIIEAAARRGDNGKP